jgi:hypothetical protein
MENGPNRAEFWKSFILEKSGYPSPERLREQFDKAEFTDFCDCGCNSFGVKVPEEVIVRPLLPKDPKHASEGRWSIFEADFRLPDDKTLEIIIFAHRDGNLAFVEVDCCANSYPVPDEIEVSEPPFHTHADNSLFGKA